MTLFGHVVSFLSLLILAIGCSPQPDSRAIDKINFDLEALDPDGLLGPPSGKRALSYEYCVPDEQRMLDQIRSIDPTAEISISPGRIGCRSDQRLVLGNTHQPHFRRVLLRLVSLPEVEHVEQAFFE